jgi:hypothetical protein
MRFAAVIIGWLMAGAALAAEPVDRQRVAVVVALHQPSANVDPVSSAHEHGAALIERLGSKAGYSDVRALIGSAVTADAVLETVRSALRDVGPEGLVFFAYLGHGAGGDFGEPALLTHGASLDDPAGTGLDVAVLAKALQPQTDKQNVIAVLDAVHLGSVDGVALIGPTASDWPGLSVRGMTVITPNVAGLGADGPGLVPVVTQAMTGLADGDENGRVSLTELIRYTGNAMSDSSGTLVDTAGTLQSDRTLAVLAARSAPATRNTSTKMSPLSTALMAGGGVAGAASLAMYWAKRGECREQGELLRCGDDDSYRRYRFTQHALGWVGGGLVVAGLGLRVMPSSTGLMVQVSGRY